MRFLKSYKQFNKLNELVRSREELGTAPKSEIEKYIEPALMTQDEYLSFVNSSNKWHDQDAYNYSLGDNERALSPERKEKLQLVKQKKIGNLNIDFYLEVRPSSFGYYKNPDAEDYSDKNWTYYTDEEKSSKKLPLKSYTVLAVHREEEMIVGAGQDEWGAVLIWVLDEYRGLNIGPEIVKIYREYYPSKDSGGFTSFGYNQAKKYHAFLVRKYLSNGIYSDMARKEEISMDRAKDIISSIKGIKRFKPKMDNPLVKYYGDSGQYSLYMDDRFVVIYDTKLLNKNKWSIENHNIERMIFDKTIKAYVSVRWNTDDRGFYDLFSVYSENKEHFKNCMDIALSLYHEGISNRFFRQKRNIHKIKELSWIKEWVDNGEYYTEEHEVYKDIESYDILKIKNPISDIEKMKDFMKKKFQAKDPYDELLSTIIETAEDKWFDYAKDGMQEYRFKEAMDKIKEYHQDDPTWVERNFKNSNQFMGMFRHFYGENEWSELSSNRKSDYQEKVIDFYHKEIENKVKEPVNESVRIYGQKSDYFNKIFNVVTEYMVKEIIGHEVDLKVYFRKMAKKKLGHVDIIDTLRNLRDKKFKLYINKDGSPQYNFGVLAHEITHINQIVTGKLSVSDDKTHIMWEGKPYISVKDLLKIETDYDFETYKNLPWEAEAYTNQKEYPKKLMASDTLKNLKSDSPQMEYIIDLLY